MNIIQKTTDFIYFIFDRFQPDFFQNIHDTLNPIWNVVNTMSDPWVSSSVSVFDNLYNISVFKHDLYVDLSSGPTIQIQKAKYLDEIIEIENHEHQNVLWYLNTKRTQPIIKTIKNRKELEKYFGWNDKYFKEFLKQMKPSLINWI